ncbi:MAG: hypothetical protein HC771_13895 [Synechococcales cyanobacterium CRU_2_2]|nr:hypothetical protein [Synechococcales cyanobacterium CRU_2_2]
MTKTVDTRQEQALDSALAELDQWFGLAGVGMDGAEHGELTAQALIEDALNEETLNEEIIEAGTAVQHMPLVESADAVETAEFEQVLAWATAQAPPLLSLQTQLKNQQSVGLKRARR